MFFNIDADDGAVIRGWVALDNPSLVPSVTVLAPGRPPVDILAHIHRGDVQDLGIHLTGQVGFEISSEQVPGLESLTDVMLVETVTRLPLFRRAASHHVPKRLFLFDCSLIPQNSLVSSISNHFCLNYLRTETLSLETMLVVLNNKSANSIFCYGRSNYNRYVTTLNNSEFLRGALLSEPLSDLAERLIYLKILSNSPDRVKAASLGNLEPLLGFAHDLPLADPKGVLRAFRSLDPELRQALANPQTRVFGCNFDEVPTRRHVSMALENLAGMDFVGTKAQFTAFHSVVSGALDVDVIGDAVPYNFGASVEFAKLLAGIGMVTDLLEYDLDLYAYVEESIASCIAGHENLMERDTHSI